MRHELTEGSLYSGYGGLGMALRLASALPVRTLWHCDPDPDCAATLEKHSPGVPNQHLDNKPLVPWSRVEVPDVVTLSCPCQPASAAGRRGGADDPRWRWPYALVAVRALRAPVVFFENVAGLTQGRMRPLWDGILSDLRDAGYQVAWTILGACYVGAPHCRRRVFAVGRLRGADAGPATRIGERAFCDHRRGQLLPSPVARDGDPGQRGEGSAAYWANRRLTRPTEGIPLGAAVRLLPTPVTTDAKGARNATAGRRDGLTGTNGWTLGGVIHDGRIANLLPTPQGRDGDARRGDPSPDVAAGRLESGRRNLPDAVAARLLPSPRGSDAKNGGPNQGIASGDIALSSAVQPQRWGEYATAVAWWEALTRPAPDPTEPTARGGGQRLAPALPEWMMGLPDGHLTGHLPRPAAIRLAGNGVVPLQAAAAFRILWPRA